MLSTHIYEKHRYRLIYIHSDIASFKYAAILETNYIPNYSNEAVFFALLMYVPSLQNLLIYSHNTALQIYSINQYIYINPAHEILSLKNCAGMHKNQEITQK